MEVYTIGFAKRTAPDFFGALRRAGIRRLVDVRLNNTSQLAGFTKRDDLPFLLHEICRAEYRHDFSDAVDEARFLMRARRKLSPGEKDNFGIVTPDAITGIRDRIFGTFFIVAMGVPGIALVVGAIVIMNIMLVSVTERTKEIGLRKSLGARRVDILKQFLTEAVTLATIGGSIGVFLAWIVGKIMTAIFLQTYLSLFAIVGAIGVSAAAGVVSGIFPAWKAARLDPIEALRTEN